MPEVYDYSGKSRGYQDDNGMLHRDYAAAVAYRESQARNAKSNQTKSTHTGLVNDKGFGIGNGRTLNNGNILIPNGRNTHISNAPITLGGRKMFPMKQGNDIVYVPRGGNNDSRKGKGNRVPNDPSYKADELKAGQDAENFRTGAGFPGQKPQSGDPPLIPPTPLIDTTQSAPTPVVTRSRDETYNAFLQQYGFDGEKAKAAADTRGDLGSAYRAGDPLAPLPDALRPGSEAYMQSEDMRIWAQANPELAKKLRPPTQAKIGGKSYSISEEAITDTMDQNPGVDREQAISLIRNGGRQPQAQIGGKSYDIEESAIIDVVDQNPGMSRQQALDAIRGGNVPSKVPATRLSPTGQQVPNEAVDSAMERKGLKPNQSVDMTRSEEPYAGEMTMGKRYANPQMNRASAHSPLKLAAVRQWDFTGTQGGSNMQPSSGLNEATTLKAPLKWQQGNIHSRADEDAQYNDDFLTPEEFVLTVQEEIGKNLFGPDYRSLRSGLST